MLCYRDMTFCPFWEPCRGAERCGRACTPAVQRAAALNGLPISQFLEPPDCYDPAVSDSNGTILGSQRHAGG